MKTNKIYKMLSIAGSDNTCGAGIQADIKTCQALNAYCLTCVTTITSQNSKDVLKDIMSNIVQLILEMPISKLEKYIMKKSNKKKLKKSGNNRN